MQVDYELKQDSYGKTGIFSKQFIKKGTLIWDISKSKSIIIPTNAVKPYINSLSQSTLLNCLKYAYFDYDGYYVDITLDDIHFITKSSTNNIVSGSDNNNMIYATRDIMPNEELFNNYNMYGKQPKWYEELLDKNNINIFNLKS